MADFRILSFDGGGIRGLLSAVILEQLDARVPDWRSGTDLLAGTSTGGIIALGLAKGLSPTDIRGLYYDKGSAIFSDNILDDVGDLFGLTGAEYGNKKLRRVLRHTFGEGTLGELRSKVLVPSFDLDNQHHDPDKRQWKPKFFHNLPGRDSDRDQLAYKVALYTSAAPTYFPSVDGFIDGGVVTNNPSMAALALTQDTRNNLRPRPKPADVALLSIGTGQNLSRISKKRLDWGYVQWGKPLIELILDGAVSVADYQCRQILGKRYHRINHVFANEDKIGLDDHERRDDLVRIGEEQMSAELDATAVWLRRHWTYTGAGRPRSDFRARSG